MTLFIKISSKDIVSYLFEICIVIVSDEELQEPEGWPAGSSRSAGTAESGAPASGR